jgi:hypothetical protein
MLIILILRILNKIFLITHRERTGKYLYSTPDRNSLAQRDLIKNEI